MQGTNRKRGYNGVPAGGFTVSQGGVRGLNFALESQLGKRGGLAQSTANKKVNRGNIKQGASTEWVTLKGPLKVRKKYVHEYQITNYGFKRDYNVTSDYGEVTINKDIISFVPNFSGWVSIKVNGREFNIRCNTDNIQPPHVNLIGFDEINGGTLTFGTSPFRMLQDSDGHRSSSFQVSEQSNFADKMLLDLEEVTSQKVNFSHTGYQKRGTVFARASYEGSFMGFSEWGPTRKFSTPKVVTNTAPNLGNGNIEPIAVNLVIPPTGFAELSTDAGWNMNFSGNFDTSIPTGNSILTVRGAGGDGETIQNPGQPYIAPSGPIYETRSRQVWVPNGYAVTWVQTSTAFVYYVHEIDYAVFVNMGIAAPGTTIEMIPRFGSGGVSAEAFRQQLITSGASLPGVGNNGDIFTINQVSDWYSAGDPGNNDSNGAAYLQYFTCRKTYYTAKAVLEWQAGPVELVNIEIQLSSYSATASVNNWIASSTSPPANPVNGTTYVVRTASKSGGGLGWQNGNNGNTGSAAYHVYKYQQVYTYRQAAAPSAGGYYKTEFYQEQVGWTYEGQPYIAPFTTYTTGKSTVVTFNDQVLTFEGGYGGPATPTVKTAQLVSGKGSGGTVDPTPMEIIVPEGGELTIASDKGFRQTYSSNANVNLPSSSNILTLDGRGAPGKTIPNPGLPQINATGPKYRISQNTTFVSSIPARYKGIWGSPVVSAQTVEGRINDVRQEQAFIQSLGRSLPANPYMGQVFLNQTATAITAFQRATGAMDIATGKQAMEDWGSFTLSNQTYTAVNVDTAWRFQSESWSGNGRSDEEITQRVYAMFPNGPGNGSSNWDSNNIVPYKRIAAKAFNDEFNVTQPPVPADLRPGQTFTRQQGRIKEEFASYGEGGSYTDVTTYYVTEVWLCAGTVHTPAQGATTVVTDFFEVKGWVYPGQAYVAPYFDYTTGASTFLKIQGQTHEFKGGYGGPGDFVSKFHFLTSDDTPNSGFGTSTSIDDAGKFFVVGSPRSETTSFSQLGAMALYEMLNGVPTQRRRFYSENPPSELQTTIPTGGHARFVTDTGFDKLVTNSVLVSLPAGIGTLSITAKGGAGSTINRPGQPYIAPSGPIYETRTREVWVSPTPLTYKLNWTEIRRSDTTYADPLLRTVMAGWAWAADKLGITALYVLSTSQATVDAYYPTNRYVWAGGTATGLRGYFASQGTSLPISGTSGTNFTVHNLGNLGHYSLDLSNFQGGPLRYESLYYFTDTAVTYTSSLALDPATGKPIVASESPGYWKTESYQELVGYTNPGQPFIPPSVEIVDGPPTLVSYLGKVLTFLGGHGGEAEETTQNIGVDVGASIGASVFITGNSNFVYTGAPNEAVNNQSSVGAIYEFSKNAQTGALSAPKRITAPTPLRSGLFGYQMCANKDGSRVFVSAPGQNCVFYFTRVNGELVYKQTIAPTSAVMALDDHFGENLACDALGNNLIVGAPGKNTGSAFIFSTIDGNSFAESKKLVSPFNGTTVSYNVPASGELLVEEYGGSVDQPGAILATHLLTGSGSITPDGNIRKFITRGRGAEGAVNQPATFTYDGVTHQYPSAEVGLPSEYFLDIPCFTGLKDFGCDVDISADGTRVIVGASKATASHTEQGAVFVFEKQGTKWVEQPRCVSSDPATNGAYGSRVSMDSSGKKFVVGDPGGQGGVGLLNLITENDKRERDSFNTFYSTNQALNSFGREVAISGNGELQISSNPLIDDNRGYLYVYAM